MPGNFLLEDAKVTCSFGGSFTIISKNPGPTVTVGGLRILNVTDRVLVPTVEGALCNKQSPPVPCTCRTCIWTINQSAKVKIGGRPALLNGANATAIPQGGMLTAFSPTPNQVTAT